MEYVLTLVELFLLCLGITYLGAWAIVAPPGTQRHIPRLPPTPIGRVRRLESEVIADCRRNIQPSPIVQIWLWPFILEHVLEMIRAKWAAIFPLRVASAIFLSNSNPAILAH